jgi:integrase
MQDKIIKPEENPFLLGYKLKWEKPDVTKMDWDEVVAFRDVDTKPFSLMWTYQQAFLFALYNDGMRFQDVCNCRWEFIHKRTFKYRMLKNGKVKVLDLPDPSMAILKKMKEQPNGKFVFHILDSNIKYDKITIREAIDSANQVANEQLGKLAKEAELRTHLQRHLTTHVAVHTFTHLADEKGWGLTEIQEARKHSSVQTTRDYIGRIRGDQLTKKRAKLFK